MADTEGQDLTTTRVEAAPVAVSETTFADRVYYKFALLGLLSGLMVLLLDQLSPAVIGASLLILLVLSRRGTPLEWGVGIVSVLVLTVYLFHTLASLLWPFIISFIIAYLLAPLVGLMSRRMPRTVAIGLLALLLMGLLTIVSIAIVPRIISEVWDFVLALPGYGQYFVSLFQKFEALLADYTNYAGEFKQRFIDKLPEVGKLFADQTTSALQGLTSGIAAILNLLIIPFVTFYVLKDYDRIGEIIKETIPTRYRNRTMDFLNRIDLVLGQYIRGQMIVSTFIAVLTAIGLSLSGVRYAMVLGLTAGALNLIPFVGLTISFGISLFVALMDTGGLVQCLKVVGVFVIVQGIEGNFLSPKVVGERVGLHPAWVMFALVVSANLWGMIGMLIAIPAAAVVNIIVRIVLQRLYDSRFYDDTEQPSS
jgi:predicted PurR-regulated permease PerM